MVLVRPRLTDYYGIHAAQESLDFAIPLLDEDIPLYVDPFLLWKSPSLQDQALHVALINAFNGIGRQWNRGNRKEAQGLLIELSECDEVGLGVSTKGAGKRIGPKMADEILSLFSEVREYRESGFIHFEECQLYVAGISKDRISDITCNLVRSFLIDYTTQCCRELGVPTTRTSIRFYNHKTNSMDAADADLPARPTGLPLLLVPRRWLRFVPWLNFDDYYKHHCPLHDPETRAALPPAKILRHNRENYGLVRSYVELRERTQQSCNSDPLFTQIPVTSAKTALAQIQKTPIGKTDGADRQFEELIARLYASMFYPQLDFAGTQARTMDGVHIRDLVFYNNTSIEFLSDIFSTYRSRQIVFEMKNVTAVGTDHVNQISRYLSDAFGSFGIIVCRNRPRQAILRNAIDLWSAQRKCVLFLTDEDTRQMVDIFESKQRHPLDVVKRAYADFQRACPK